MLPKTGTTPNTEAETLPWSLATRIAFRISALYLFLYSFRVLLSSLAIFQWSWTKDIPDPSGMGARAVPWVSQHVFRMASAVDDQTSEGLLIELFLLLVISVVVAAVWSLLDRRRPNYRTLDASLRLWLRFVLASVLLIYGFGKVFPTQFGQITLADLVVPMGSLTHKQLMWHVLASSNLYKIVGGCMEVTAAVMLLVPCLSDIGALLSVAVMTNVALIDVGYNVSIKVFVLNLLLVSVFLVAPQLPRLADMLVLQRAVPPRPVARLSRRPGVDISVQALVGLLGAAFFVLCLVDCRQWYTEVQQDAAANVPLRGIWQVEEFHAAGGPLFAPQRARRMQLLAGDERWLRLIFQEPGVVTIQTMNGAEDEVNLALAPSRQTAELSDDNDSSWKGHLTLQQSQPDRLSVIGSVNGAQVAATLHRVDQASFPLTDTSLHLLHWGRESQ